VSLAPTARFGVAVQVVPKMPDWVCSSMTPLVTNTETSWGGNGGYLIFTAVA
jgi:hypothetical protein